ncbi:MAG: cell division protein ZapA [Deltaproteobacteria bacterium]|nr:cell division protein ZapA [Deltaproteobacteria bacterium]
MEKIITIDLLGEEFKFRADDDDAAPEMIADFLMKELKAVESGFPAHVKKTNKLAIVVLAALNIARQNIELKKGRQQFMSYVTGRANRIEQLIDATPGLAQVVDI